MRASVEERRDKILHEVMPLLIIGSMFTLVANFPIPAWIAFLKATTIGDYTLSALIAIPASCTVSMMALFIAFNIGYNFAEHIGIKDRVSAGIVSLASWLILMALRDERRETHEALLGVLDHHDCDRPHSACKDLPADVTCARRLGQQQLAGRCTEQSSYHSPIGKGNRAWLYSQ